MEKTFGLHPLICFLDATGEALAGLLHEGRAGSNTTADHITVLDMALAQIPDPHRHGTARHADPHPPRLGRIRGVELERLYGRPEAEPGVSRAVPPPTTTKTYAGLSAHLGLQTAEK